MKSLIILSGSNQEEKQKWIEEEDLKNYTLKIDTFYSLYTTPELLEPGIESVRKSYGNLVFERFYEALIIRLGKGCLVVVDPEKESTTNIERLAKIHGYQIFYKLFDRKVSIPLEITTINTYEDLLSIWTDKETMIDIKSNDGVLHISDLHSNSYLWRNIMNKNKLKYVIHHGDYIDGPERGGSRRMIEHIINCNNGNWFWLEGNHELRLRRFLGWKMFCGYGSKVISDLLLASIPKDFLYTTGKEFEYVNSPKALSILTELNKRLKTHIVLSSSSGEIYLCTHAGLRFVEQLSPKNIGSVIYGNRFVEKQDKEFSNDYVDSNIISIHAHCKYTPWNPKKFKGVYNIDPFDENEVIILSNCKNKFNYVVKKSSNYGKC